MKSWGLTFSFAWIGETACHWTLQFTLSVLSFPSLPCLHCPGFLWVAKARNYRMLQHHLASALGTSPLPSVSFIRAVACFCWEFLHLPHKLNFGCFIIKSVKYVGISVTSLPWILLLTFGDLGIQMGRQKPLHFYLSVEGT